MLGTSVTAFSLLECTNLGKSPPDDSSFASRMRTYSVGTNKSVEAPVGHDSIASLDEEMTFAFDG